MLGVYMIRKIKGITDFYSGSWASVSLRQLWNAVSGEEFFNRLITKGKTEMLISGFGDAQLCAWRCSCPEPELSISEKATAGLSKSNTNTLNINHKLLIFKFY